jgi:DNA polymerase/3'-5' exonuclease PolX
LIGFPHSLQRPGLQTKYLEGDQSVAGNNRAAELVVQANQAQVDVLLASAEWRYSTTIHWTDYHIEIFPVQEDVIIFNAD